MKRRGIPYVWHISVPASNGDSGNKCKGLRLSLLTEFVRGDLEGHCYCGIISCVEGKLEGSSYGTLYTSAKTNGGFAFQMGFTTNIADYNPEGFVMQVGIMNSIGRRLIPGIQFRGWNNIFRKGNYKKVK